MHIDQIGLLGDQRREQRISLESLGIVNGETHVVYRIHSGLGATERQEAQTQKDYPNEGHGTSPSWLDGIAHDRIPPILMPPPAVALPRPGTTTLINELYFQEIKN
jgi:hypothetical protein